MAKHILTAEDLEKNPELEAEGLKVGDEIDVPETVEEQSAPESNGEVNHNLHEAEVTGYDETGKPQLKVGAVIRTGIMLTPESAEQMNFLAQRAPVGGTMHVYAPAE